MLFLCFTVLKRRRRLLFHPPTDTNGALGTATCGRSTRLLEWVIARGTKTGWCDNVCIKTKQHSFSCREIMLWPVKTNLSSWQKKLPCVKKGLSFAANGQIFVPVLFLNFTSPSPVHSLNSRHILIEAGRSSKLKHYSSLILICTFKRCLTVLLARLKGPVCKI